MSVAALQYGPQTVGTFTSPSWLTRFMRPQPSTHLNKDVVAPEIAAFVSAWEDADILDPITRSALPATEVEAVDFITQLLRISRSEVLAAVGIPEKTFYNWAGKGNRPRATSTGALWPMARALHELSQVHKNLAAWFHSSDAARQAFYDGDTNALVVSEATWSVRRGAPTIRVFLADELATEPAASAPRVRERRTSTASNATKPRRRPVRDDR